jgi:hypothetical protein
VGLLEDANGFIDNLTTKTPIEDVLYWKTLLNQFFQLIGRFENECNVPLTCARTYDMLKKFNTDNMLVQFANARINTIKLDLSNTDIVATQIKDEEIKTCFCRLGKALRDHIAQYENAIGLLNNQPRTTAFCKG